MVQDAKYKIEQKVRRKFEEDYPEEATPVHRVELNESPIYQLSKAVLEMDRYKNKD